VYFRTGRGITTRQLPRTRLPKGPLSNEEYDQLAVFDARFEFMDLAGVVRDDVIGACASDSAISGRLNFRIIHIISSDLDLWRKKLFVFCIRCGYQILIYIARY